MAKGSQVESIVGYVFLLCLSPLIRVIFQYLTQREAESNFVNQRVIFFKNYSFSNSFERGLFNQASYIKKEGFRLLHFEVPNSIILIVTVAGYALTQSFEFRLVVFFAMISGALGFGLAIVFSKNAVQEILLTDTQPMRMKEQFISSYLTYRNPLFFELFLRAFNRASNTARSAFLRFFLISIAPGAFTELSVQLCFLGSLLYFWYTGGDFYQLIPLFFQIGAVMATFSVLSASYPTISAYLKIDTDKEPIRPSFSGRFDVSRKGVKVTETDIVFLFGGRYRLAGKNGSGKSSFLDALGNSLSQQGIKVAFLNQKTDLDLLVDDRPRSDGERQRINFYRVLDAEFDVLILDEALASVDSDEKDKIIHKLKDMGPRQIVILVDHNDQLDGFDNIDFESRAAFLMKGN